MVKDGKGGLNDMNTTTEKYQATIGLEIHVQLDTKSKMFCRCDNNSETAEPNTNVCPVCMGYPGVLPVMNEQAIDWGIKLALALGCTINPLQRFDRKNYFYPDLPKAYQISQFFYPVGEKGNLDVDYLAPDRKTKKEFAVGITRLHLEEDAGKLVHEKEATLVDLNRCGTPLAEIVTEPDIKSPEEAKAFLQELQRLVRSLGVSKADMEKGHLRVDANVSVRPMGQDTLGAKVEVKNMNSFRFMEQALKYEIERQIELLEKGERVMQETRGWDEKTGTTVSQRSKEGSVDYRYFPEPDLPPIYIDKEKIDKISETLPMSLSTLRLKAEEFGLPYARVGELQDIDMLFSFVWIMHEHKDFDPVLVANWLPKKFSKGTGFDEFIAVVMANKLSSNAAQKLYEAMQKTGKTPAELVGELKTMGSDELEALVRTVMNESPDVVVKAKAGDNRVVGYLVGQVMAKSQGAAEPALVKEILDRLLTE
ncbi:MAG: Asp-tRNA(Asn)/Glu-tRNA(Gln) amidotransferase subunit GatB [Patescibacteria group bacterium]